MYSRAVPGRTLRYRNMPAMPLPPDCKIPTCARCRAWQPLSVETQAMIAPILQARYRELLKLRVRRAIELLERHSSQRRIEALLGLSPGYLCRLKAGARNPSPELVSYLASLAREPEARLAELESYWSQTDVLPDPTSGVVEPCTPPE